MLSGGNEYHAAVMAHRIKSIRESLLGYNEAAGLRAYGLLHQQPVLHDVLVGSWHLQSCPDVKAFVFRIPGLHILRKLFIHRH